MKLITEPYLVQVARWPIRGRHILAYYDEETIIVYQAYRPSIGHFAAEHGYFGGEFSLTRMSWIKTNFLWMMYRSAWGTSEGQEVILAIRLNRTDFDEILKMAVHSTFMPELYGTLEAYQEASRKASVRLQWDPDHHPSGPNLERRAIQLGLRGETLAKYAREWIVNIEDISEFVAQQREVVNAKDYTHLLTPREAIYPITNETLAAKLGLTVSHKDS